MDTHPTIISDPTDAIDQLSAEGFRLLEAGDRAESARLFREVLQRMPRHPDALHAFGILALQDGRAEEAARLIGEAVRLTPDHAACLGNLGLALQKSGRGRRALGAYRRAIAIDPAFADAWCNLGTAHEQAGALDRATAAFRRALAVQPALGQADFNLGNALRRQGRRHEAVLCYVRALGQSIGFVDARLNLATLELEEGRLDDAIDNLRQAITFKPDLPEAHMNLGGALAQRGEGRDALMHHACALVLRPDYAEAWLNLGSARNGAGMAADAVAALGRALTLRPAFPAALANLGAALHGQGRIDRAAACHRRALLLDPATPEAENDLGSALQAVGRLAPAARHYRRALALAPATTAAHSNLLMTMSYDPAVTSDALFDEYRRWEAAHARPRYAEIRPHPNDRAPERALRVGFLSADLRAHPVAWNLEGLFRHLDRERFRPFAYAEVGRPDETTLRLRALVPDWRGTIGRADREVAAMIRDDAIDVLVVVAGHTAANRIGVAAFRPAPVQVSFGDFSTSGLSVMDYWITDAALHPDDTAERFTETLVRLPVFEVHKIPQDAPDPGPPPALAAGHVTFGSCSNPAKIGPATVALWSGVLHAVPDARLLLKFFGHYGRPELQAHFRAAFAAHGVAADRLVFVGEDSDRARHLEILRRIDIALDPVPFNGCTTTFEALWMGVPVVALAGERFVGRVGAAMLTRLGLDELVAADPAGYVRCAAALAADAERRARLRGELRRRLAASPLVDAPAYARAFGDALRGMWRTWCAGSPAGPPRP